MILGRWFLPQKSQQLRGFSEFSVKGILGQVRKSENRLEKTVRGIMIGKLMKKIDRRDTDRRDINRRIAERFTLPLKGKATFTVAGAQDQREITVKNISAYGAYFSANLRPEVSDSVTLHLPVEASDGPFEATATVVRVEEVSENIFGIAVKFEKIPDFG
jgi:hypothetical protein